jgi:predicted phosphodiesterase
MADIVRHFQEEPMEPVEGSDLSPPPDLPHQGGETGREALTPCMGEYAGILFIGDPHAAASPPGFRLDSYAETVLGKLSFSLEAAAKRRCLPIILGDLFHVPRDNPNSLLVALIEMFRPHVPWVLVGNHDKYEARLTRDVSLAVLDAAGVIRLLDGEGPVASMTVSGKKILIGASPDWTPIPAAVDPEGHDFVVWLTHHDLAFPGYESARTNLREIPGVDLVVNGHIHTPKPAQRLGRTLWCNPGSLTRISRSEVTRKVKPVITAWVPGTPDLDVIEVPHQPFDEIFPAMDLTDGPEAAPLDESMFIRGLENLALRKTSEGVGLRAFLETNLTNENPIDAIIWELYEETMRHGKEGEQD